MSNTLKVRFDDDAFYHLKDRAIEIARKKGYSMNYLAQTALERYVAKYEADAAKRTQKEPR